MFSSAERAQLEEHERWMRVAWQPRMKRKRVTKCRLNMCSGRRRITGGGGNRTRTDCDPTAHAEIVALRAAAQKLGNYRLADATVYSTVELARCAPEH